MWAGDWQQDPGDDEILAIAHREQRVLVTLDKEFGDLAIVHEQPYGGILRIVGFRYESMQPHAQQALDVWYDRQYEGQSIKSLIPPRMVLVGLGVDDATERMVNFLVATGVEISLVTFQGFEFNARTLLARHVEVDSTKAKPPSSSPYALFEKRAQTPNIQELLQVVTDMFMRQHSGLWHTYSSTRRNFLLDYS